MYLTTKSEFCRTARLLAGFITETDSVYCAVRNGSLSTTDYVSSLKALKDERAVYVASVLVQKSMRDRRLTMHFYSNDSTNTVQAFDK